MPDIDSTAILTEIRGLGENLKKTQDSLAEVKTSDDGLRASVAEMKTKLSVFEDAARNRTGVFAILKPDPKRVRWNRFLAVQHAITFPHRMPAGWGFKSEKDVWDYYGAGFEREACGRGEKAHVPGQEYDGSGGDKLRATALQTTMNTYGGFLVPEEVGGFIEKLRPQVVAFGLGASETMTNAGLVTWNRQGTAASVANYTAEGANSTQADMRFEAIELQPHAAKTHVIINREALLRADPSINGIVDQDLALQVARNLDKQILYGPTVSGAPKGIVNYPGSTLDTNDVFQSLNGPADGGAGALALASFPKILGKVKVKDAFTGRFGWAMHPTYEQRLGILATAASIFFPFMWAVPSTGDYAGEKGSILGHPYKTTTQLTVDGTTAATSGIIGGDFSQITVYRWAPGVEFRMSEHVNFLANQVVVQVIDSHDILIKHPAAFCGAYNFTS